MTCLLQQNIFMMTGSQDRICLPFLSFFIKRPIHLIRSPYISRPLNRLSMTFTGSGICTEQIIKAVTLEDMRPFQKNPVRAVNILYWSDHFFLCCIKLLKNQTPDIFFRYSVVCHHTDHIFFSIIIMKQRRVKTKIIQWCRF